jgi:flagellar protein FlaG
MVNPISGLPPTLLSNFVQEVSPGKIVKEINGDEPNVAAKSNTPDLLTATEGGIQPKAGQQQSAEQSAATDEQSKNVDYSKLAEIVRTTIGSENVSIEFTKDKETDRMIMQIIDTKTDEIIRQFPPEITLKIAKIVAKLLETTGQVTNAQV